MPQHDMILENQAGAAFRADGNDALAALVSNSSGATAPTTTYSHMFWADTTTAKLKQRNSVNTDWIVLGDLDVEGLGKLSRAGGEMTGAINDAITTVASTATPDIWTDTAAYIDYTGTITTTGFAAAPQAGSKRTLILAAAAPFTAGANLLIDGYASGSTVTLTAADRVEVLALTTTTFRMSIRSNNSPVWDSSKNLSNIGSINTGAGITTGAAAIELGGERTGDGQSILDFHATSGSNYETRAIRYSGANGNFELFNTGTGLIYFSPGGTAKSGLANDGAQSSVIPGAGGTLYGQYVCRAWVNFNGTGVVSIRGSANVSSITDHGTGDYTINLSTAMPDANYAALFTAGRGGGDTQGNTVNVTDSITTSSARILIRNRSDTQVDQAQIFAAFFR